MNLRLQRAGNDYSCGAGVRFLFFFWCVMFCGVRNTCEEDCRWIMTQESKHCENINQIYETPV
jgi:hypothetical protein